MKIPEVLPKANRLSKKKTGSMYLLENQKNTLTNNKTIFTLKIHAFEWTAQSRSLTYSVCRVCHAKKVLSSVKIFRLFYVQQLKTKYSLQRDINLFTLITVGCLG